MVATLLNFIGVVSLCFPYLTLCEVSLTKIVTTKQISDVKVNPTLSGSIIRNGGVGNLATNNIIHSEVNDDNSSTDSPYGGGSDVNLAFLPGFALLCFIVAVLFRVCKWQRESAKFKDRGCSYDIASYVILVQGDKDFHDIDARTDCTSNCDTVTSYSSIVRINGYHETITSCRSLQYRIDSKAYDTVTSYQTFLYKKQREKLNSHITDAAEVGNRDRVDSCNSMTVQEITENETPKLPKGSRFSVVPAIDNYMRLKESVTFSKYPITEPSTTRRNDSENYVSPKILKRSISDSPTRSIRKSSKKIKNKQTNPHTSFRQQDLERHASVKSDITHSKRRYQQQVPAMVNAETQIEYPFKRSKSAKYTNIRKATKSRNSASFARHHLSNSTKVIVEDGTNAKKSSAYNNSLNKADDLKDNNRARIEPVNQKPMVPSTHEQQRKNVISVSATVHNDPEQIGVCDSVNDTFMESQDNELHSHKHHPEKTGGDHTSLSHSSCRLCSNMSPCSCYPMISLADSSKQSSENDLQRELNGVCLRINESDDTSLSSETDDDCYQNVTDSGFMENEVKRKVRTCKKSDCTCPFEQSVTIENENTKLLNNSLSETKCNGSLKDSISNSDSVNLFSSNSNLSLSCSDSEFDEMYDNCPNDRTSYSTLRTEV